MPLAWILSNSLLADATTVLSAVLVLALLARGLHRQYPFFFGYWILDLAGSGTLHLIPTPLDTNNQIKIAFLLVKWVAYFLLIMELVDQILTDHPGLARLGRRAMQIFMILGAGASIYILRFDSFLRISRDRILPLIYQSERVVTACLLLFLIAILLFLWFFPVRMSRNTKVYFVGFAVWFLVKAIAPFLISVRGLESYEQANNIQLLGVLCCQILWLIALSQSGVKRTPPFNRGWSPEEQRKTLARLDALERQISRPPGR